MRRPPSPSNQIFNNADGFAQAFDEAWQEHNRRNPDHGLTPAEKAPLILALLADHPFLLSDPHTARQVAEFRIRLLDL